MTKRQLIKWLEAKREEAIGEVCSQATDTLNTYYTDRNTKIELEETASEIANLMKQVSDKVDAFKASRPVKRIPFYSFVNLLFQFQIIHNNLLRIKKRTVKTTVPLDKL